MGGWFMCPSGVWKQAGRLRGFPVTPALGRFIANAAYSSLSVIPPGRGYLAARLGMYNYLGTPPANLGYAVVNAAYETEKPPRPGLETMTASATYVKQTPTRKAGLDWGLVNQYYIPNPALPLETEEDI